MTVVPHRVIDRHDVAVDDPWHAAVVQAHQLPVDIADRRTGRAFIGVGLVMQKAGAEDVEQAVVGEGELARPAVRMLDDVERGAGQDLAGRFDQPYLSEFGQ